ncbi:MAG: 4Fe-4S binding protein [Treponema sp.]|jgi:indolepyruvate ferredoxin oxidoreductase alpha subunit|nr:4Fe-4S binding protein [Treponema sp.]
MKRLLMGNEAIALGAIRAGVKVVTGYPGTPSTEILETIVKERNAAGPGAIYAEWSVNEKTALEVAAGAAISGVRALVTMKQVGLNVASDPLMSLNYVGVKGGLVLAVADDPGPISSQTEQDTRHFGQYAKLAVFDPASPEEAYAMIADAFDCSEKYGRPVIFRPTTRICHSYASVEILPSLAGGGEGAAPGFQKDGGRWVIFPSLAYRNHIQIEKDLLSMADDFSRYSGNRLSIRGLTDGNSIAADGGVPAGRGIAAGGVSYAYAEEALAALSGPLPVNGLADGEGWAAYRLLKVATVPLPTALVLEFLQGLSEVLVIEELDPVIERELICLAGIHHLPVTIRGRLSGDMPNAGENKVSNVEAAVKLFLSRDNTQGGGACYQAGVPRNAAPLSAPPGLQPPQGAALAGASGAPPSGAFEPPALPVRPPVLCAGCPHRGSFFAVKEAVRQFAKNRKAVYSGDIGCYTLGNAPPLDMVDTCLCMGAGVAMAQGINRSESAFLERGKNRERLPLNIAFIGYSTFFHTGIPGVVNAVYNGADIIVVILDNSTAAMTGNQPHPGMGRNAAGNPAEKISIAAVLEAVGVKHILKANPFDTKAAKEAVAAALDKTGVRAIIFQGPCIMASKPGNAGAALGIRMQKCTRCRLCISRLGCPAISLAPGGAVVIDPVTCTGCGVCAALCPSGAIVSSNAVSEENVPGGAQ